MKRIFIDTNILVDLVLERKGFYQDARRLFNLCKERRITPYISSISVAIINYLLLKKESKRIVRNYL